MKVKESVIFLDIDGVLNYSYSKSRCCTYYHGIDKDKVQLLAAIVAKTGADLVLTSSWKTAWKPNKNYDPLCSSEDIAFAKYLDTHLRKKGNLKIKDKISEDITEYGEWCEFHRGAGIAHYLKIHPEIKHWVVLDDMIFDDFYRYDEVIEHFVHVLDGLTTKNVKEAIEILKK